MCLMHKSNDGYGKILLKQKYKQNSSFASCFASQFARHFAWREDEILASLQELLDEKVLLIKDDFLMSERMIRDCNISQIRRDAGKKGGMKNKENFAKAKVEANTGIGIEYGNEDKDGDARGRFKPPKLDDVTAYCNERKNKVPPQAFLDHYQSNGWKVGKNSMKDWKAAVRNWERNEGQFSKKQKSDWEPDIWKPFPTAS